MIEQMAVEVDVKSGGKNVKNRFFLMHFMTTSKNVRQIFLSQMKFKNKISYLGEKISILPKKMTEQMEVEVDVKSGGRNAFHDHFQKYQTEFFCLK